LIWDSASELLTRGVDVILDDGFFFRENRMQVVAEARALGASAKIHYLKVPLPELQARLASRNASLPQFNFLIDPQTLDAFIDMFEVPLADEGGEVVVIQGDAIDSGASSG
jgi:predicted kinase